MLPLVHVKLSTIRKKTKSKIFNTTIYNDYFIKIKGNYYMPLHTFIFHTTPHKSIHHTMETQIPNLQYQYEKFIKNKQYETIEEVIIINNKYKTLELLENYILKHPTSGINDLESILTNDLMTTHYYYLDFLDYLRQGASIIELRQDNKINGDYPHTIPLPVLRDRYSNLLYTSFDNYLPFKTTFVSNPEGRFFIINDNIYKFPPVKLPKIFIRIHISEFDAEAFMMNFNKYVLEEYANTGIVIVHKYYNNKPVINPVGASIGIETESIYILLPMFKSKAIPELTYYQVGMQTWESLRKKYHFLQTIKEFLLIQIPTRELINVTEKIYTHKQFNDEFYIRIPLLHNYIKQQVQNNIIKE